MLKAGTKKLREAGMLEWMYYVRPEDLADSYVPQEDPEVTLFPKAIINVLVRDTSIRNSVVAFSVGQG